MIATSSVLKSKDFIKIVDYQGYVQMYSTTKAGALVLVTLLKKNRGQREISELAWCNTRACAVLFSTVSTTANLTEHFFEKYKFLDFRIFDDAYLIHVTFDLFWMLVDQNHHIWARFPYGYARKIKDFEYFDFW